MVAKEEKVLLKNILNDLRKTNLVLGEAKQS